MKRMQRWVWMASLLAGMAGLAVRAEVNALVKGDRVNVRAKATLNSEVITQLKKGETVAVLEEVDVPKPKRGEPAKWSKIRLPSDTTVWVFAPYIEPNNSTVNVNRLNLRSGPGENFSVIGRIERGTPVKKIRESENWMEIEAPEKAYAFVASELLDMPETPEPGPATTQTVPVSPPATNEPPPAVENVQPEQVPVAAVEPPPATEPVPMQPATTTTEPAATEPAQPPTTPPIRIVTREGTVVYSRSIQAPTMFGLESLESHRIINYLHSEDHDITLTVQKYAGKRVIVTGEELIDQRWQNTPILEVTAIEKSTP